jgi:2-polyprenyl-3-methyl-5-hydroxy-6-metoxy-1,4-benzoquinol methylase
MQGIIRRNADLACLSKLPNPLPRHHADISDCLKDLGNGFVMRFTRDPSFRSGCSIAECRVSPNHVRHVISRSLLVKVFGWRAALIHGDSTTLDRWMWLAERVPLTTRGEQVLDVGCGTGAFTIGLALRGYTALGLSWDARNQKMAQERAQCTGATGATFEICDVRRLDDRTDLFGRFEIALLCEVIEHILNDEKLVRDAAACLRPGGRVLLTTPNSNYRPITPEDAGPFPPKETGWHVRKGYSEADLAKICQAVGLRMIAISYCSGFLSQKLTWIYRVVSRSVHPAIAWLLILPLRILPLLFDRAVTRWLRWPEYSICLEASKPLEK